MSDNERTVIFQLPSILAGQIVCVEGTVAGRSWELSAGTFVIGRRPGCDLYLPQEPGVSKTHAKIIADGEHYVLVDEESRNGTIVNGRAVRRQPLLDGDTIQICGCKLRFSQASGLSEKTAVSPGMSTSVPGRPPVEAPMLDLAPPSEDTNVDADTSIDPPMPPVEPPAPGELADFTPPGFDIAEPPPTEHYDHADEPTEISRPAAAAPPPRRGSTVPSFFVGLVVALFVGGGAYAGILFIGDGTVPAVAQNADGAPAVEPVDGTEPSVDVDPANPAPDTPTPDGPPGDAVPPAPPPDGTAPTANDPATPGDGEGAADPAPDAVEPAAGTGESPDPAPGDTGTEVAEAADKGGDDVDAVEDDAPAAVATSSKPRRNKGRRGARKAKTAKADPPADPDEDDGPADDGKGSKSGGVVDVNVTAGRAKQATVSAKSAGAVDRIKVKVGDAVEAGAVLVEFKKSSGGVDTSRLEESVRALEEVVRSSGSEEAKAALATERKKLEEAKKGGGGGGRVTANIAGVVKSVAVRAGQAVAVGDAVATIESEGRDLVYATISAKQAQKFKIGSTVKLKTKRGNISGRVVSKTKTRSGRYTVNIDPGATDAYDVQGLRL